MTGYGAIVALAAIEGAVRLYRIRAENKATAAKITAATERRAAQ